jgi:hypothetical protein
LDRSQKIHTMHNYLALVAAGEKPPASIQFDAERQETMRRQLADEERSFTTATDESKRRSELELRKKMHETERRMLVDEADAVSQMDTLLARVAESKTSDDFLEKLDLANTSTIGTSSFAVHGYFCGRVIRTFKDLQKCVKEELTGLFSVK